MDNPDIDIFKSWLDQGLIQAESAPALLDGIWILRGKMLDGKYLTAIPYHLWANLGEPQMTVWMNG